MDPGRPQGFQPASAFCAGLHVPSSSSNRDASGGQPPLPQVSAQESTSGGAQASGTERACAQGSEPAPAPVAGPSKPVNRPATSRNAIIHSSVQRKNPMTQLIRNVGLEIGDIVADFQVGAHAGVLFLSLKYHRLHPEYVFNRIERMRNVYTNRILLILCDITEHQQPLRELSKVAVINDLTIIVAFSNEEAAQYLTTLKQYEHKSADSLKERVRQTYPEQLEHVLTSGRKVNRANAETLAATFGSFANMVRQPSSVLTAIKGIGPTKTLSLFRAFNEPFVVGGSASKRVVGSSKEFSGSQPTGAAALDEDEDADVDMDAEAEARLVHDASPPSAQAEQPETNPPAPAPAPQTPPTPLRPTDDSPPRSPSLEPDPERAGDDTPWHDPLDDDDEDEEERPAKRTRL